MDVVFGCFAIYLGQMNVSKVEPLKKRKKKRMDPSRTAEHRSPS